MSKKNILVTGGAGFIGSHLSERLVNQGHQVVVIDNLNRFYSPKKKRDNISLLEKKSNYSFYKVDIRDTTELKRVFNKYLFDCVVHLAAMAGVRPSLENPSLYADVNVTGTANILELTKKYNVEQFIFASSSSVYGNRAKGPFREQDDTDQQVSPYGATKKAGELLCRVYSETYGQKVTILRFFTVYGPRNRPDMACYKFVEAVMNDKPIMRFGAGDTGRDYTYIADIVSGIKAAIDKPFDFEIINLGNSDPIKLNDLIRQIGKTTKRQARINELPLQPGDVLLTFADISKARKLLNWQPKTNIKKGLKHLIDWYIQKDNE